MDRRQQYQRRFGHLLTSPLTALKGAFWLLQAQLENTDSARIRMLLETIGNSVERLERAADLIHQHAAADDDGVLVRLPGHLLPGPHSEAQAARPVHTSDQPWAYEHGADTSSPRPARQTERPRCLLLLADTASDQLITTLHTANYQIASTNGIADCLDLARQLHPDLVLIDVALARRDQRLVQVLQDDPETKTIPLLYLCHTATELAQLPPAAIGLLLGTDALHTLRVVRRAIDSQEIVPQAQFVLIVDDEADIRRTLALELETHGFRTAQVASGTEALLRAQQQRFDLIILDLMLPDLDGFAVLGGLRARAQTALTPIILLSALNKPQEKVQGLQLGADDYITKPFVPAELSARVRAAIRRSELEGSANPSTRLPGNIAIERAISRRIEQGVAFAVCYCDLDNFKSYNDTYGFLKGDSVIHQTARVLVNAVEQMGNADDFVGHIGGDDFVLVTTPERARAVCQDVLHNFDALAPLFYDAEARERGYIEGTDRRGRHDQFPLVSISIMVVTNERTPIHHLAQVAQRAIEAKKLAKQQSGSTYVIDP